MPPSMRAHGHRGPAVPLIAGAVAVATAFGLGESFLGQWSLRHARGSHSQRRGRSKGYEWDIDRAHQYFKADNMKYQFLRWDPQLKGKTRDVDHAAEIIMNTGRIPRPLKCSEIKLHRAPIKRVIVANKKERRKVAEMVGAFYINSLKAKLMLKRDVHPVWGHERIVVYGKVLANYLQPCADTNEPLDQDYSLKFRAAFRDDEDPWAGDKKKDKEQLWNDEVQKRGWGYTQDGEALQPLMEKYDEDLKLEENIFGECMIDNVLDVGELVLQNFAAYLNQDVLAPGAADSKIPQRIHKRLQRELGDTYGYKAEDKAGPQKQWEPQDLYDKGLWAKTQPGFKAKIV